MPGSLVYLSYITQVTGTTKFVVVGTFSAMESASLGSDHWMLFIRHELVSPQFWMIRTLTDHLTRTALT